MENCLKLHLNGSLTWFKQERRPKHQQILSFAIVKWSFVPSLGLKTPKISRRKFLGQSYAIYWKNCAS